MPPLTIVCDLAFESRINKLLAKRVAPNRCLFVTPAQSQDLANRKANAAFAQADIALGQTSVERIAQSPRLRWLHVTSAGYTRYDTPEFRAAAKARGLVVTNSSSVFAESCATHVFSFLLAQMRQLPTALKVNSGLPANEKAIIAGLNVLRGQRVTLVGFGTIARHLIRMLALFGVAITAVRRQPRGDEGVPTVRTSRIASALANADHVIDLLPANADSEHFFNAARFRAMKRGACFYNIGRGVTVDQRALAAALRSGKLRAAWLDATTPEPIPLRHELRRLPTCHITPHLAGNHPTWA
ncbi:MAG TPA: NAD(P)-dependent oxidoreductase, partial [Candidatus Methylacidiphilales bacterium]|nr:NAD(P)-dependent oxidoreductase [Candidatus Methylacidiphilales bacterium]